MTREHLFAAFFFAVFLFLLYQFYQIVGVFLVPLTWAALLALIFYPLQRHLARLLRGHEGIAAFALTTLVIGGVMVPTVPLTVLLANESVGFYQRLSEVLTHAKVQEWLAQLRVSTPARAWGTLQPLFDAWQIDLRSIAERVANGLSTFLATQAADIAKNIVSFVVNSFLTTFALFFFFRDGQRMVRGVRDMLPMEQRYKDLVLTRVYETVSAVVQGTLVTAALQGVLSGFGYWAVGVPFAVFFGCASGLASLLPLGSPVVWGAVAAYLAITGSVWSGVLLAGWGMLIVGIVDNVIRPLIIGGRTEIPTVWLFFGILGGLQAYGFLGIFLAPAVIAVLVAFARIYKEQYGTAE